MRIHAEEIDHPVLRTLKDNDRKLDHLFVFQYLGCDESRLPEDAVVLARYGSEQELAGTGSPAIVERPIGKGRVILITTSIGDENWAEMFVARANGSAGVAVGTNSIAARLIVAPWSSTKPRLSGSSKSR